MNGLEVVGLSDDDRELVAEGVMSAVTEQVIEEKTSKGWKQFLVCRISEPGKDEGETIKYLLPDRIHRASAFYRDFIIPLLGSVSDVPDLTALVQKPCRITVKHIKKGKRVYANVVAIRSLHAPA